MLLCLESLALDLHIKTITHAFQTKFFLQVWMKQVQNNSCEREGREWAWVGARGEMGSVGPRGHSHTLLSARKMNPLASLPHPKNSFRILSASFFSCLAFQQTAQAVATWIKAVKLIQLSQFEALAFSISPRLYRAALKGSSQVLWNWVKKLRFVCLLQAEECNFLPQFHTTWEGPFSAAL